VDEDLEGGSHEETLKVNAKSSVKITCNLADIRTEFLPGPSVECCSYTIRLCYYSKPH
jgi:hypothetical protein